MCQLWQVFIWLKIEKFYSIVTTEIERRSINPEGFEKYLGSKNRKQSIKESM